VRRPQHLLVLAVALPGLALVALAGPPAALADDTIALVAGPSGFRPNSVTVHAGERVVFRNDDRRRRRIVGDRNEFSTTLLAPGESAVIRFDNVTTVGFHDAGRPELRGAVVVLVPPQTVTIRASATRVTPGTVVELSGRISPARARVVIQLLRIRPDGAVDILDTTRTRRDGRYAIGTAVSEPSTYRVRWERLDSRPVRIRVR
jgi:hypothetical protein